MRRPAALSQPRVVLGTLQTLGLGNVGPVTVDGAFYLELILHLVMRGNREVWCRYKCHRNRRGGSSVRVASRGGGSGLCWESNVFAARRVCCARASDCRAWARVAAERRNVSREL